MSYFSKYTNRNKINSGHFKTLSPNQCSFIGSNWRYSCSCFKAKSVFKLRFDSARNFLIPSTLLNHQWIYLLVLASLCLAIYQYLHLGYECNCLCNCLWLILLLVSMELLFLCFTLFRLMSMGKICDASFMFNESFCCKGCW